MMRSSNQQNTVVKKRVGMKAGRPGPTRPTWRPGIPGPGLARGSGGTSGA